MTSEPVTISFPNGHKIETFGIHRIAGACVHFHQPDGVMFERLIATDFLRKPQESMKRMIDAFQKCLNPEAIEKIDGELVFTLKPNLFILCDPNGTQISISNHKPKKWTEGEDGQNPEPVLYYVLEEWEEDPEIVIGALLNCLHNQLNA